MKCDRCNATIEEGEEREHFGQLRCEDCYMVDFGFETFAEIESMPSYYCVYRSQQDAMPGI
jgi:hypothetical protein